MKYFLPNPFCGSKSKTSRVCGSEALWAIMRLVREALCGQIKCYSISRRRTYSGRYASFFLSPFIFYSFKRSVSNWPHRQIYIMRPLLEIRISCSCGIVWVFSVWSVVWHNISVQFIEVCCWWFHGVEKI